MTSRGSIMSPPEYNGGPSSSSSTTNLTSKIVSLKGRLSGAFSYWTGREKSPTQEKPCKSSPLTLITLHVEIVVNRMTYFIMYVSVTDYSQSELFIINKNTAEHQVSFYSCHLCHVKVHQIAFSDCNNLLTLFLYC